MASLEDITLVRQRKPGGVRHLSNLAVAERDFLPTALRNRQVARHNQAVSRASALPEIKQPAFINPLYSGSDGPIERG